MKGSLPALVAAIVSGRSLMDAADAAGMSVSTAQRRLKEPSVVCAVEEARADLMREAVGRLGELRSVALDRLASVLAVEEDGRVILRAVDLVLRHASAADLATIQQRLVEIERQIDQGGDADPVTAPYGEWVR